MMSRLRGVGVRAQYACGTRFGVWRRVRKEVRNVCSVRIGRDGGECLDGFEDFFFEEEEEEEERESLEKGLKFGTVFDPASASTPIVNLQPISLLRFIRKNEVGGVTNDESSSLVENSLFVY